jgi:hypothetical protein
MVQFVSNSIDRRQARLITTIDAGHLMCEIVTLEREDRGLLFATSAMEIVDDLAEVIQKDHSVR